MFDTRLHRRGEFLHFPRAVARVGEDEVDVVAVVGVVDGDVFRFARSEGDVAEDAVAAEADGRDVVLCQGEVARVGEEGGDGGLFLFARDTFQAKQVAVHVFAVQAVHFPRQVFSAVRFNERLDAVAVGKVVNGGRRLFRGVGHGLHIAFAPVDVVTHIDVFAAAAYGFVHFVLGVLQGDLHQCVGVVVFEQVLFLVVEVEVVDAGGVAFGVVAVVGQYFFDELAGAAILRVS